MAAKRFPMRLKQLREAKGWSQARLADEAGVTREYIARLETGKHDPPLSRVEKLAIVLGVPIVRLIK
jgi:transcriptional regulator with XRE-family HTH domain